MAVTGNRIEEIEKHTFAGLDHLRVLDLDRNRIYVIDSRAFDAVPELRCLRLAGNNIRVIYEDTFLSVPNLQVNLQMFSNVPQRVPGYQEVIREGLWAEYRPTLCMQRYANFVYIK